MPLKHYIPPKLGSVILRGIYTRAEFQNLIEKYIPDSKILIFVQEDARAQNKLALVYARNLSSIELLNRFRFVSEIHTLKITDSVQRSATEYLEHRASRITDLLNVKVSWNTFNELQETVYLKKEWYFEEVLEEIFSSFD